MEHWSEPASAQPIDGYEVYFRLAGADEWEYADYVSDTSTTVTDLTPGTDYEFMVVAWDITEDDPGSDDSNTATIATAAAL